jgi:hypothetical protein
MNGYAPWIGFLLVIFGIVAGGFYFYQQSNVLPVQSTFVLSQTPQPSPAKTAEPIVTDWTTYSNTNFNFTLTVPDGWNQQTYKGPYGATIVAFSPNNLPCGDCSYVHDGFFSVKIFNQTTDQQAYKDFTDRQKAASQDPKYQAIQIQGKPGLMYGNIVDIPNNNFIYEVSLDTDNGNDTVMSSKIFQKIAGSLQFTNLVFTN